MYGVRSIYRLGYTLTEGTEMADMIKVIMCHKYGREGVCIETMLLQSLLKSSETHSSIYKDARILSAKIITVSAASAGKTHKTDHQPLASIFVTTLRESSFNVSARSEARSVPGT